MKNSWTEIVHREYIDRPKNFGNRGIFVGGSKYISDTSYSLNEIEYVTISMSSDALDFGDLTQKKLYVGFSSNGYTGIICGGKYENAGSYSFYNVIEYITFSNKCNGTDVGDLQLGYATSPYHCSNNVLMVVGGGGTPMGLNMLTISFAMFVCSSSFGTLTTNLSNGASCSDGIIGLFCGGNCSGGYSNSIEYITYSQLSNAVDFADMLIGSRGMCGCSSDTRGVVHMGTKGALKIQYVTFATKANAVSFGVFSSYTHQGNDYRGACSNNIFGLFAGGSKLASIERVIMSVVASISTFGNLPTYNPFISPTGSSGD